MERAENDVVWEDELTDEELLEGVVDFFAAIQSRPAPAPDPEKVA